MLVILDKDGTLVKPISDGIFVQHPEDQQLLPGVADRIRELKAAGATLVIASNQGGCEAIDPDTGKPRKSIDDAIDEMRYCMGLLPEIESAYFCPDFGGIWCHIVINGATTVPFYSTATARVIQSFRKPAGGMLMFAMRQFDDGNVIFIGDSKEDSSAAFMAKIPFVKADDWREGRVDMLGMVGKEDVKQVLGGE